MLLKGFSRSLTFLLFVITLGLFAQPAHSDTVCKGLEESACRDNQACTWISSYTTGNGNTISAYCRKSGAKSKQDQNLEGESGTQSSANDRTAGAITIAKKLEENKSGS
jgi:hypothetical protein